MRTQVADHLEENKISMMELKSVLELCLQGNSLFVADLILS